MTTVLIVVMTVYGGAAATFQEFQTPANCERAKAVVVAAGGGSPTSFIAPRLIKAECVPK